MATVEKVPPSGTQRFDRRLSGRQGTALRTTCTTYDLGIIDAKVVEISSGGCRIETDVELETWGNVSINLPGLEPKQALIAWRRGEQYGCAFHIPLGTTELSRAGAAVGSVEVRLGWADDLAEGHRHWSLPLDAILAILGFLTLFAVVIGHWCA